MSLADVASAHTEQTRMFRRFQQTFRDYDLVLAPTTPVSPFPWSQLYLAEMDGKPLRNYYHWLSLTYVVTLDDQSRDLDPVRRRSQGHAVRAAGRRPVPRRPRGARRLARAGAGVRQPDPWPDEDFGLILPKGSGARFEASVRARLAEQAELGSLIEPLLAAWRAVDDQVAALERQLVRRARRHEVCHRLMTVPGVGPLTALAFVTTIDDPARFRRSSSVGAYLGLTPRRHQSGERDVSGRISKCGDRLTRSYLFEAANVLLTRVERWSSLKAWAIRLAKRSGAKKAKVALARKLAALLHRLWQDGTTFRWTTEAAA